MPIPPFTANGVLPTGIYDTSLSEVEDKFGRFRSDDDRVVLFQRLTHYLGELFSWGHVQEVLLDGSFVSSKDNPGDIDLIIVLKSDFDYEAPTTPTEYNVLSGRRISRTYNFDAKTVSANSLEYETWVNYFSQDTRRPGFTKGLLRLVPHANDSQ